MHRAHLPRMEDVAHADDAGTVAVGVMVETVVDGGGVDAGAEVLGAGMVAHFEVSVVRCSSRARCGDREGEGKEKAKKGKRKRMGKKRFEKFWYVFWGIESDGQRRRGGC
jgi:hypothetical protein